MKTIFTLACFCFLLVSDALGQRKPNIIFIHADDLGYGDLSCYGQQKFQTPNIDRLAREGMRFTQYYAGSTVCAPSRSALMTGQHTGHTRIRGNARHPLQAEDVTVAEVLKQAGYATALTGKWGLGEAGTSGSPNQQGFDYFYGYLNQAHAHNYYPTHLWRNEAKVPLRNVVPNEGKEGTGVASVKVDYSHDLIATEALQFVEQHARKPFFLYFAVTIPHANNEGKNDGMEVPDLGAFAGKDWPLLQKQKAAMIARLDRDVGRLLQRLSQLGIDRNTIVFFTSDNGPHKEGGIDPDFFDSNGPLRGIKRALYEGGIRVPMIVRWPGRIKAGSTSEQQWAHWDFLPTAAALAGANVPASPTTLDGLSFVPTLLGRKQTQQHEYLYWEFHEGGFKQAIRQGNWKALLLAPGKLELYDLSKDIGETHDLAAAHPDVGTKFATLFNQARTESAWWPVK